VRGTYFEQLEGRERRGFEPAFVKTHWPFHLFSPQFAEWDRYVRLVRNPIDNVYARYRYEKKIWKVPNRSSGWLFSSSQSLRCTYAREPCNRQRLYLYLCLYLYNCLYFDSLIGCSDRLRTSIEELETRQEILIYIRNHL
jgi:hypothetical protein